MGGIMTKIHFAPEKAKPFRQKGLEFFSFFHKGDIQSHAETEYKIQRVSDEDFWPENRKGNRWRLSLWVKHLEKTIYLNYLFS